VDGLITHRFTLDQANEALDAAASKDSLKVAIRIAQS
jgi:threonine dehydrogenase-like Zn-dependent dehydrogenase